MTDSVFDPVTDQSWRDDALCREIGPAIFFPGTGHSVRPAKRICAQCEVRSNCLEFAVRSFVRDGVWGGCTRTDFERIRRERGLAEPQEETA